MQNNICWQKVKLKNKSYSINFSLLQHNTQQPQVEGGQVRLGSWLWKFHSVVGKPQGRDFVTVCSGEESSSPDGGCEAEQEDSARKQQARNHKLYPSLHLHDH